MSRPRKRSDVFSPLGDVLVNELLRCRAQRSAERVLPGLSIGDDEAEELLGQLSAVIDPFQSDRLNAVHDRFALASEDIEILLMALAPEFDERYERIYAYLQDDATARAPSVALLQRLVSAASHDRSLVRRRLASDAPLRRWGLIHLTSDAGAASLSRSVRADDHIVDYLSGVDGVDARLQSWADVVGPHASFAELVLAPGLVDRLQRAIGGDVADPPPFVMHFHGPRGSGRRTTAEAVAAARGSRLLVIDGERLAGVTESALVEIARLALRETRLFGCALYVDRVDSLFRPDRMTSLHLLIDELQACHAPLMLGSESPWNDGWKADRPLMTFRFAPLGFRERLLMWTSAFGDGRAAVSDLEHVASVYRLPAGRIRRAAAHARGASAVAGSAVCTGADLAAACRAESATNLGSFGHPVVCRRRWNDLVLSADRLEQLREVCRAVRFRGRVYDSWGFEQKLALGKGVNVLFSGPPGTGKTMAAEVLASELGFELYRIDLSAVVSKFIGETEKNLSRVFTEAEAGNAMLFFDEADALFGKRTEVRDAHDRYANVEVSYLLSRLEQHDGIVILASNLRKNVDEAFVRRMHFTVEFPLPEYAERLALWERIWPDTAPRAETLDLAFLARQFELSGGHIRNAALAAAFVAAEEDSVITMAHVIAAIRREYQKMGTVILEAGRWAYPTATSSPADPRGTAPCVPEQPTTRPN